MGRVHRIVQRDDGQIRFAVVTQEHVFRAEKAQLITETHYVRVVPTLLDEPMRKNGMYWVEGPVRTARLNEPEYRGFEHSFIQASKVSLF